jgi:hypothetical protein
MSTPRSTPTFARLRRRHLWPLIAASALGLAACGTAGGANSAGDAASRSMASTPTTAPSTGQTGLGLPATPEAIMATAERIFVPNPRGGYEECEDIDVNDGQFSLCPVTPRLLDHLREIRPSLDFAPFCRCQNDSPGRSITAEPTATGGVAHVSLFDGQRRIDLVMTAENGRLLVDDTRCTDQGERTSIFFSPASGMPVCDGSRG